MQDPPETPRGYLSQTDFDVGFLQEKTLNKTFPEYGEETKGDSVWTSDMTVLFDWKKIPLMIPKKGMTFAERVNAITRSLFVFSVIIAIVQKSTRIFTYLVLALVVIVFVSQSPVAADINENFDVDFVVKALNEPCQMPSPENPYMNWLPSDNPDRLDPCRGPGVQKLALETAKAALGVNSDDPTLNDGYYNFYTVPNAGGNPLLRREEFAKFLLKDFNGQRWNNVVIRKDQANEIFYRKEKAPGIGDLRRDLKAGR